MGQPQSANRIFADMNNHLYQYSLTSTMEFDSAGGSAFGNVRGPGGKGSVAWDRPLFDNKQSVDFENSFPKSDNLPCRDETVSFSKNGVVTVT